MKNITIITLLIVSLLLLGCAPSQQQPPGTPGTPPGTDIPDIGSCSVDADCICGGIDRQTGKCFLGSKAYYDRYVDKKTDCPDFCTGIAGNLVTRCVDNKCMQMYECLSADECAEGQDCVGNRCVGEISSSAECRSDKDCRPDGCSGQICRARSAEPIFTTCEYKAEYDCLKMVDCGCIDGECAWSTSPEYEKCVKGAEGKVTEGPV
jgi:eight-cysteine-cluster-containing protein